MVLVIKNLTPGFLSVDALRRFGHNRLGPQEEVELAIDPAKLSEADSTELLSLRDKGRITFELVKGGLASILDDDLEAGISDAQQMAAVKNSAILEKTGNLTVQVKKGSAAGFHMSDGSVMMMDAEPVVNLAANGLLGLDTGTVGNGFYAIYSVKNGSDLSFAASASMSVPTGYAVYGWVGALKVEKKKIVKVQQNGDRFKYVSRIDVDLPREISGRTAINLENYIPSVATDVILSINAATKTTLRVFVKGERKSFDYAKDGDQKSFEMPLDGHQEIEITKEGSGTVLIQVLGWIDGSL